MSWPKPHTRAFRNGQSFKHGLSSSTLSLLNAVRRRQGAIQSGSYSEGSSPCTPPSTPRERKTGCVIFVWSPLSSTTKSFEHAKYIHTYNTLQKQNSLFLRIVTLFVYFSWCLVRFPLLSPLGLYFCVLREKTNAVYVLFFCVREMEKRSILFYCRDTTVCFICKWKFPLKAFFVFCFILTHCISSFFFSSPSSNKKKRKTVFIIRCYANFRTATHSQWQRWCCWWWWWLLENKIPHPQQAKNNIALV